MLNLFNLSFYAFRFGVYRNFTLGKGPLLGESHPPLDLLILGALWKCAST